MQTDTFLLIQLFRCNAVKPQALSTVSGTPVFPQQSNRFLIEAGIGLCFQLTMGQHIRAAGIIPQGEFSEVAK
jgi:hypothetical protein